MSKGDISPKCLDNIEVALDCLEKFGVDLTGITKSNIYEGNQTTTLGLIWKIIKFCQGKRMGDRRPPPASQRQHLLFWCQSNLRKYKSIGVEVTDFGPSWKDGLAFIALLHHFKLEKVNIEYLKELSPNDRLKEAFTMAKEEFGADQLLFPQDLQFLPDKDKDDSVLAKKTKQLDDPHVLIYISELYKQIVQQFPDVPHSDTVPEIELSPLDSWAKFGEEFKTAVTKLERKMDEANELVSHDLDSEMGTSMTIALDKYEAMCHPGWLRDGDNILKEAEECVDQVMMSGNDQDAAQLEQKLADLSREWEDVKKQLILKGREVEFQKVQTEVERLVTDGLHKLDQLDAMGPLDNVLQQQQDYKEFFEEKQFETVAQSHLKKLLDFTEEEKKGDPDGTATSNFDQIVVVQSGRLTSVLKRAANTKARLDESIRRWTSFTNKRDDVEVWIREKERQLSEIDANCKTEWSAFEDIDKALQQVTQLTEEVDKYEDFFGQFIGTGKQLKDDCYAQRLSEQENMLDQLEDKYKQLKLKVDKLTRPLTALQSSWQSFISVSGEIQVWLDDAQSLLQECNEVEDIKDAERCVKKHKDFFTPPVLHLQNSKLTCLKQHLEKSETPQEEFDTLHHPGHLSDQLRTLDDRFTEVCQKQESELEYLEILCRYLQVTADVSQYLQEIELLLSELESNRQSPDKLHRAQSMLHELIPKQEKLQQLKKLHSQLTRIKDGRNVSFSLDGMNHRFQEVKTRQAALYRRMEIEEEAEELIGEVEQDVKRAREILTFEIEYEAEGERVQVENLQKMQSVLSNHEKSVSDSISKLTDTGSSKLGLQQELTDLVPQLKQVSDEIATAEEKCQKASLICDDVKKVVRETEHQVRKVDTALEIPWRKNSTSRRLALQECQSAVSVAQVGLQESNLSTGQKLLTDFSTLTSSNHVVYMADILDKSKSKWEDAVKRANGRIQVIQCEQLISEAKEKLNTARIHLNQLEPILEPNCQVEETPGLQSHLEYFLNDFETAMASVRNSLFTFTESFPSDGEELTNQEMQETLDELFVQTNFLQSRHKLLVLSMTSFLAKWQEFHKQWNEFSNWMMEARTQFEELRDDRGGNNHKEERLKRLVADFESKEVFLELVLDTGDHLCQSCILKLVLITEAGFPNGTHLSQDLSVVKEQFDQLQSQAIALEEAEIEASKQTAEYTVKALLLREWLEDVHNQQHQIADTELAAEEDRKALQAVIHEEFMRRQHLTSLEECFDVLSHNLRVSGQIKDDLKPNNIRKQFDGTLRAVRLCLVTVMLNEADEMLSRGHGVLGDRKRFQDALEEQEQFFADSNHLENTECILNEVEDSNVTDGTSQTETEVLRQRMDSISGKEPQVHSRLASGIAAWKQHDEHYTDLKLGANQCGEILAEFQSIPAATSPQEVADRIIQLNEVDGHNKQLFSVAGALREQINLLTALATPEQHKNISNAADALYSGLEGTSRTIRDLKFGLQEQLQSANKQAEAVERDCAKFEQRISDLDAKVSSLPAIEYHVKPLSDLSHSIEAIQKELEGYKKELQTLKQTVRDLKGFVNESVAEQLQALDRRLDNLSAKVVGKTDEIAAATKTTADVTEKFDNLENRINAISSNFEGDLQDRVGVLELSAIQGYFEKLQGCCHQLEELRPEVDACLKPFPTLGSPATTTLEMRAKTLTSQIETAANRGLSQLEMLTDIRDKIGQMESDARSISLWAGKAIEAMSLEPILRKRLEELKSELDEKKALLSDSCVTENTLIAAYSHMDHQSLSSVMENIRTQLQKVQETLVDKIITTDMESFDELYSHVMVFLENIESQLESQMFDLTDDIQQIEWKINRCQSFKGDLDAHTSDYGQVCEKADKLKSELKESKHPILDGKFKKMEEKWGSVVELLTKRLCDLRDQLKKLEENAQVITQLEGWLEKKKQWLSDLNDIDDQSRDPSDIAELEELTVQINERTTKLAQLNDKAAEDLVQQYVQFENDVNIVKTILLGEQKQKLLIQRVDKLESQLAAAGEHMQKILVQRIGKLEAQLAAVGDSTGLSPSQRTKTQTVLEAIESDCKQLHEEIVNLKRKNDSEPEVDSQSGYVDVGVLDELLARVDHVIAEAIRKLHEYEPPSGVEQIMWNFNYLVSFLLLFLLFVVLVQEYEGTGQGGGLPLQWFLTMNSDGPALQ
jgi:DNA repair exonuclease SbcCD ATPase subunit